MTSNHTIEVPLYEIAHGRTGDKGDRLNVSIIPYDDSAYNAIAEQATEARMLEMFRHRGATHAQRYDLPKLKAFNFVLENVLQGGVNNSLNLDGHGKTLSFHALTMTVCVSPEVLDAAKQARDG
jgi:hypothetical protein